jgi:hypothetical protein
MSQHHQEREPRPVTELRPTPSLQGEVLEATGEVDLSCIVCRSEIGVMETVATWNRGRFMVVAHVGCVTGRVRPRAPLIRGEL